MQNYFESGEDQGPSRAESEEKKISDMSAREIQDGREILGAQLSIAMTSRTNAKFYSDISSMYMMLKFRGMSFTCCRSTVSVSHSCILTKSFYDRNMLRFTIWGTPHFCG